MAAIILLGSKCLERLEVNDRSVSFNITIFSSELTGRSCKKELREARLPSCKQGPAVMEGPRGR